MRRSAEDAKYWLSVLDADQSTFVSRILTFFGASDGIVAENMAQQCFAEVQEPKARCFYGLQLVMYVRKLLLCGDCLLVLLIQ